MSLNNSLRFASKTTFENLAIEETGDSEEEEIEEVEVQPEPEPELCANGCCLI